MGNAQTADGIPIGGLAAEIGQRWTRQRWFGRIPDQPIIHLVRASTPELLTEQLGAHLGAAVPHVRMRGRDPVAVDERNRSVELRKLLDGAVREFIDHDARQHLGRFQFERYALLSWLLKQNLKPAQLADGPNSRAWELLREYIGARLRKKKGQGAGDTASDKNPVDMVATRIGPLSPPWWATLLAYLLAWVIPRAVYGGPRIGAAQRWFMRQHYLAPRESADFASFAQRLLTTPSVHENAAEVRKLLVHAFLEDLAEGYARNPMRLKWVRRRYYPVLLLDGVSPGTLGEEFVRLVNDVRNETGAPDPLLIIASGPAALQEVPQAQDSLSLDAWPDTLRAARRRRSPTAWYVPVLVSDEQTLATVEHSANPTGAWAWRGRVRRPKFGPYLRFVPAVVVAGSLLGAGWWYVDWSSEHCGQWNPWSQNDLLTLETPGPRLMTECTGVAAGGYVFSPADAGLAYWQERIAGNNSAVEGDSRHITVVYFGTFTKQNPESNSPTLLGAREELEGVVAAQDAANKAGSSVPMRVVLANGGEQMSHAPKIAALIASLARDDPTVAGVVGLGQSRETTYEAIRILGNAGLPMIGSVTSGNKMAEQSKLYYQVAPQNSREAAIVAYYVRTKLATQELSVYYTKGDEYSSDLATRIHDFMPAAQLIPYGPGEPESPDPTSAGRRAAREGKAVFFAGRSEDLEAFLQGSRDSPEPLQELLAGDDTIKFVLNEALERFPDVRLDYISFANTAKGEPRGREVLAYDAATLMRRAAENVRKSLPSAPLNPMATWRGLAEINGVGAFGGDSGLIDFGRPTGQIPVDKAVSVQRVMRDPNTGKMSKPDQRLLCGKLGDDPGDPGCPHDPPR